MKAPFELRLTNGELLALISLIESATFNPAQADLRRWCLTAKAKLEADFATRL